MNSIAVIPSTKVKELFPEGLCECGCSFYRHCGKGCLNFRACKCLGFTGVDENKLLSEVKYYKT